MKLFWHFYRRNNLADKSAKIKLTKTLPQESTKQSENSQKESL